MGELIQEISQKFEAAQLHYAHGTETAWDEAAWLLTHVVGLSPQVEEFSADTPVPEEQIQQIWNVAEQRIQTRKPLAYLLNSAWFCGMEFYIDERVIVPRSPIAELIANDFAPWVTDPPRRILDLCTGSACIAIACAIQYPAADVTAADISPDALAVAQRNVERYQLTNRVRLYQTDIFQGLALQRFDLIVCNPPYVDAKDMANLSDEYRYEPQSALQAGMDGLDFVRKMLPVVGNFLSPNGVLVCEVGNSEKVLCDAYPEIPFTWIEFEHGGQGVFALTAQELSKFNTV